MLYTSKVEGGEIEVRTIKDGKVRRSYVNDAEQFATVVENNLDRAVYYGVAIRKEPLKADSTKTNILGTDLLWAEVDTEKIGWDTEAVKRTMHDLPPWLRPSACVSSGYGLHFYWRLTKPIYDTDRIEQANMALRELVSGDAVWDATRILRVPGSVNLKGKRARDCAPVWCYHWQRLDVNDLLDAARDQGVLWNGKWISAEKRDENIAARRKDVNDNAHHYAFEDRNKKTTARGLQVWDRASYHGGPGMYGVDEAVTMFTAHMYCIRSAEAKREKSRVSESSMEQIVRITVGEIEKIKRRDAPGERWDWEAEKKSVREKLDRWARKWDGGLRDAAERAYKEKKRQDGSGKHGHVPRANGGARNEVGRKKSKAA